MTANRRSLELLTDAAAVINSRRADEPAVELCHGRPPLSREGVAVLHVAIYLEGIRLESARSAAERLVREGYLESVPHPNSIANWRRFQDREVDPEAGGAMLLVALRELFQLTVEPVSDLVDAIVVDSGSFATDVERQPGRDDIKRGPLAVDGITVHFAICRDTGIVLALKDANVSDFAGPSHAASLLKVAWDHGVRPRVVFTDGAYGPGHAGATLHVAGVDRFLHLSRRRLPGAKWCAALGAYWRPLGLENEIESVISAFRNGSPNRFEIQHPAQRLIDIYCKVIAYNLRRLVKLELECRARLDFSKLRIFPNGV